MMDIINNSVYNPFPINLISERSRKSTVTQEALEKESDKTGMMKLPDEIKFYKKSALFHSACNVKASIASNFEISSNDKETRKVLSDFWGTFPDTDTKADFDLGQIAYKNFIYLMSLSAIVASKGLAVKYLKGYNNKLAFRILSPIDWDWQKDENGLIKFDETFGTPKGIESTTGQSLGIPIISSGEISFSNRSKIPYKEISVLTFDSLWDQLDGTALLGLTKESIVRANKVEAAAAGAASKTGQPVPIAKLKTTPFGSKIKKDSQDYKDLVKVLELFAEDGSKYMIIEDDKVDVSYLQTGGAMLSPNLLNPYTQTIGVASGVPEALAFGAVKTIQKDAKIIAWFYEQTQGYYLRMRTELYIRSQLSEVFDRYNLSNPVYNIKFNSLIPVDNAEVLRTVTTFQPMGILSREELRRIACKLLDMRYSEAPKEIPLKTFKQVQE